MSFVIFLALAFPMKILLRGIVWEVGIEETDQYYFLPLEFSMKALPITWLKIKRYCHLTIFQMAVTQLSFNKQHHFSPPRNMFLETRAQIG